VRQGTSTTWKVPVHGIADGELPRCVQICSSEPCSSTEVSSKAEPHFSECYDGPDHNKESQKFRCTCKMGWQGEKCDQDVDECFQSAYQGTCEAQSECEVVNGRLPDGCTATGYALDTDLDCAAPYWVDASSKQPSGCDRDAGTQVLITECANTPGSWTCGACKQSPSCCTASDANIPAQAHHVVTPWHPAGKAYSVCDVLPPGDNRSIACPVLDWEQSGCTGRASASHSRFKIDVGNNCTIKPGICRCPTNPVDATHSAGIEEHDLDVGDQCSAAGGVVSLSIDPEDSHGRKTAQNALTLLSAFNVTLQRVSQDFSLSVFSCTSSQVTNSLSWVEAGHAIADDEGGEYQGHFDCRAAGLYMLSITTGGASILNQLQNPTPLGILIVAGAARLENTLAQLQDSPGWCIEGSNSTAPRCRTMPARSCQITVKVRDEYGNERRRTRYGNHFLFSSTTSFIALCHALF
jgi:hypothetical protein